MLLIYLPSVGVFCLTPDPSPARTIVMREMFFWLERGVKERGGGAPSQQTLPLPNR